MDHETSSDADEAKIIREYWSVRNHVYLRLNVDLMKEHHVHLLLGSYGHCLCGLSNKYLVPHMCELPNCRRSRVRRTADEVGLACE